MSRSIQHRALKCSALHWSIGDTNISQCIRPPGISRILKTFHFVLCCSPKADVVNNLPSERDGNRNKQKSPHNAPCYTSFLDLSGVCALGPGHR